jgi:hypothetical protein
MMKYGQRRKFRVKNLMANGTVKDIYDKLIASKKVGFDGWVEFQGKRLNTAYKLEHYGIVDGTQLIWHRRNRCGGAKRLATSRPGTPRGGDGEDADEERAKSSVMEIEDELKKNLDRVREGTKEKFFTDIVAKIVLMQADCTDATKSKTAFTDLMKKMGTDVLRSVADQTKNKVPHQISNPSVKGAFASEHTAMLAIEQDMKYAKKAMKDVMLLAFFKQFQVRGKMNWRDIADAIEDTREDAIRASASSAMQT